MNQMKKRIKLKINKSLLVGFDAEDDEAVENEKKVEMYWHSNKKKFDNNFALDFMQKYIFKVF